ncbi:MAG: hypothetical protein KGQ51_08885 [Planctomycetes bacterium]|nr:hypothetical protein [Planctomycetota bacterium]
MLQRRTGKSVVYGVTGSLLSSGIECVDPSRLATGIGSKGLAMVVGSLCLVIGAIAAQARRDDSLIAVAHHPAVGLPLLAELREHPG